jgi:hypothetical protein
MFRLSVGQTGPSEKVLHAFQNEIWQMRFSNFFTQNVKVLTKSMQNGLCIILLQRGNKGLGNIYF